MYDNSMSNKTGVWWFVKLKNTVITQVMVWIVMINILAWNLVLLVDAVKTWKISDGVLGFVGSIIGGLIGGILTLKGVQLTLKKQDDDKFMKSFYRHLMTVHDIEKKIGPLLLVNQRSPRQAFEILEQKLDELKSVEKIINRDIGGQLATTTRLRLQFYESELTITKNKMIPLHMKATLSGSSPDWTEYDEALKTHVNTLYEHIQNIHLSMTKYKTALINRRSKITGDPLI